MYAYSIKFDVQISSNALLDYYTKENRKDSIVLFGSKSKKFESKTIFRDTIIQQGVQFYHLTYRFACQKNCSKQFGKRYILRDDTWTTEFIVVTYQRVVQNPPLREEVLTFLRTYKTSESACRPSRLSHSTTVAGALPTTVTPDLDCQLTNLFTIEIGSFLQRN